MPNSKSDMAKRSRRQRSFRRIMKIVQNVMSTLALPLALGVFTVIITFQQKNDSAKQRIEDRQLADQQRDQDLNLSRLQRESDLNQSRIQRELERNLADEKRLQDYELANQTRQLSSLQRQHETNLELQRHQDAILVSYMNEISILLRENNGSLTRNPLIAKLVRLKTLTLIRRLDPLRNSEVIRFLYEAGQLNSTGDHIDLSDAELNQIDLSSIMPKKMHNLYLVGVSLQNSSFVNRDLTGANFSMSIFNGANMTRTILNNADMSDTTFDGLSQFIDSRLDKVNFCGVKLDGIDFSKSRSMYDADFRESNINHCRFTELNLDSADFSKSTLNQVDFSSSHLKGANMNEMKASEINFTDVNLNEVSFYFISLSMAVFENVRYDQHLDFKRVNFHNVTFKSNNLQDIKFDESRLTNVDFSHVQISDLYYVDSNIDGLIFHNFNGSSVYFKYCTLRRAKFSKIHMESGLSFLLSDLDEADFGQTYENLNFTYCNLTHTNFFGSSLLNPVFIGNNLAFTNMSHANLSNAHFQLMNNFSHADLRNALGITDDVFHSALSLDNTYLPNGTQIKDNPELIRNGHAKCNMSVSKDWRIEDGNISIQPSIKDPNSCYFAPVNISDDSIPQMYQLVNVTRYRTIIMNKNAVVLYRAHISPGTYIAIHELDATGNILYHGAVTSSLLSYTISDRIELKQDTVELEIAIAFAFSMSSSRSEIQQWADYIEIKIDLKIDRTAPKYDPNE